MTIAVTPEYEHKKALLLRQATFYSVAKITKCFK